MEDRQLPIKVVLPKKKDYRKKKSTPRKFRPFAPVTEEVRSNLSSQIGAVRTQLFENNNPKNVPAVAKVNLIPQAVAKTYRPEYLFNEKTCPIIGTTGLGQLLLSIRPDGLRKIDETICNNTTQDAERYISTLSSIEPFSLKQVWGEEYFQTLMSSLKDNKGLPIRLHLFHHRYKKLNSLVYEEFNANVKKFGLHEQALNYAKGINIHSLKGYDEDSLDWLLNFVGTQNLSLFPDYRIVRTTCRAIGNLTPDSLPKPDPAKSYGIVGIMNSGTDPNNEALQAWVKEVGSSSSN